MRVSVFVAAALALAVAGCGQSKEDLREQVVECSSYVDALNLQAMQGNAAFMTRLMTELAGEGEGAAEAQQKLGRQIAQMQSASARYAEDLEPARLSTIGETQAEAARKAVEEGKADRAANVLRGCVRTWETLGKS